MPGLTWTANGKRQPRYATCDHHSANWEGEGEYYMPVYSLIHNAAMLASSPSSLWRQLSPAASVAVFPPLLQVC